MDTNRTYLPIFKEIHSSQAFERLSAYRDPVLWQGMSSEERRLLAMLFLKHAEKIIYDGDSQAFNQFELAEQLASDEPEIYYFQASILYNYSLLSFQHQYLMQAKGKVEKALSLDPSHQKALQALGAILSRIGNVEGEPFYFEEAEKTFREAEELLSENDDLRSGLFWEWGKSHYLLGKLSGEAIDYKLAIEKFQRAMDSGAHSVAFWNDYGVVLLQIAPLINSADALVKAIEFFALAVKEDPESGAGWYHLGCSFQQLYSLLGQEELFLKSNDYFRVAGDLNPENTETWYQWGVLLLVSGRFQKQIDHLEEAAEKFSIAVSSRPDHLLAQCGLSEAFMLLGSYSENLDYLKQAKDKILQVSQRCADKADVWCCYGRCLNEYGRYFSDENYYFDAITKFQQGLTLDNSHPFLWHGLSEAYLSIGELKNDSTMVEKAAYYCSRAIKYKNTLPHFWYDWGMALLKLGEMTQQSQYIEDAIDKFERAIRLRGGLEGNPELEWLYHLGCAYDSLGDYKSDPSHYKKAIAFLSHVLEKDTEFSHARYNLAVTLSHLGEVTYEIDYFRLSLEHFRILNHEDGEDEVVLNDWGLTLLNLAYLMHDLTQPEYNLHILQEAENKLLHAVALGSTHAFYNLACYYSLTGQYEVALYFLQKAEAHQSLPSLDDILHDEWLEGLRQTTSFRHFISQLKK